MDLISTLRYAAREEEAKNQPSDKTTESAPSLHPDLIEAYSLAGRTAVVTGSGSGIGRQTAITLAKAGASVVAADLNGQSAEATAKAITDLGLAADSVVTDVTRKADLDALAQHALSSSGRIDVWANVAGIIAEQLIVDATEEHVQKIVAVNQLGVYWGCAAAARAMIPAGRGSIINVASSGGELPVPGLSVYGMTKAAVISVTRSLAAEVGKYGIRVNSVSPGFVETGLTKRNWVDEQGNIDEARRAQMIELRGSQVPAGRIGTPQDIAHAILFLAADASSFFTGQVVRPNGGMPMA